MRYLRHLHSAASPSVSERRWLRKPARRRAALAAAAVVLAAAEPTTSTIEPLYTAYLNIDRAEHTATQLADGRIAVIGGDGPLGPISDIEILDPDRRTFTFSSRLIQPRAAHTATL